MSFRKICISGGIFWGYETFIDINEITCLDDIINKTISNLKADLANLKFVELINNIDPRGFHIHSTDLVKIFTCEPDFVIYVCNGC